MQRLGIITSGGDAPGMNAAVRAITRQAIALGMEVWGAQDGFQGLCNDNLVPLGSRDVGGILQHGGTLLGTARCEEFTHAPGRKRAYQALRRYGIDGLILIGGDGSMAGADKLLNEHGIPIIAIPATIDNDVPQTDMAIGVDTALNTAVDIISKLRDTAASHQRTFVIETMGRQCGYLALVAGVASGAEAILVPEFPYDLDGVVDKVRDGMKRGKKHSIIVAAEGIRDQFELAQFESPAHKVAGYLWDQLGETFDVRVTVLGHVQRGGAPTVFDRVLASRFGAAAVQRLQDGEAGVMIALQDNDLVSVPFDDVIGQTRELDEHLMKLAYTIAE
jgi:6-phosphofructokinase 1